MAEPTFFGSLGRGFRDAIASLGIGKARSTPPPDLIATGPPTPDGEPPAPRNGFGLTKEQGDLWLSRIMFAKKKREPHLDQWRKFHRWFKGRFAVEEGGRGTQDGIRNEDAIEVNIVYPKMRILLSELYPDRPKIKAVPRRPMPADRPVIAEGVCEYFEDELGVDEERLRVLQDALLGDRGWLAIGYKPETEIVTDETGQPVLLSHGIGPDGLPIMRPQLRLASEQHWYRHLRYDAVVFDYNASRTKDSKWLAVRYPFTPDEMRAYFGVDPESLPGYIPPMVEHDQIYEKLDQQQQKQYRQYFVWELWDRSDPGNRMLAHILEGRGDVLDSGPWPCEIDDYPILDFWPNFVTDDQHGIPEPQPYEAQQTEKNRLRTAQMVSIERETAGVIIDENKIVESEREKFRKGPKESYILSQGNPGEAIAKAPYNGWPSDRTELEAKMDRDVDIISGITGPQHGIASDEETATGQRISERYADLRTLGRRRAWREFLEKARRIHWQILQHSVGENLTVAISGGKGWALWVPPGEIRHDWDFTWVADLSSMRPKTPAEQQAVADKAVERWNGDPLTDQMELRRLWHDAYELARPGLFRMPSPQQMAEHLMFYGDKSIVGGTSTDTPGPKGPGADPAMAAMMNPLAGRTPLGGRENGVTTPPV